VDVEDDIWRELVGETEEIISSREGSGGLGIDMLDERLGGDGLVAISLSLTL